MGEGDVMIQRWTPRYIVTGKESTSMSPATYGGFVDYRDHVAAVKAATGTALQEETEAYDHGYCIGYAAGYSRGISGVGKGLGDFCQVDECAGCGE